MKPLSKEIQNLTILVMARNKIYVYCFFLWLLLQLVACERSHPQVEAILQKADMLMEEHPDSAYSLLDSLHFQQQLSKKETARYALLLAKATDKTYQSLIPCDSLLNFALKYYDSPTAERATALLYKGCLEDEVNHDEEAIEHLQEARLILKDYPEEVSTRRIILGLLGDLYYQHKHYEDCLPVYQETLELCESDRDKSYTYRDISSYYTMTAQQDSALFYHHKAINHAVLTGDSALIANSYHSLALAFNVFSQVDSALYYENLALNYTPNSSLKGSIYYQIGSLIQKSGNLEQAAYYLNKAKEDSHFNGSFMINRVLGKIETSLGNYQEANILYKNYIDYLDSVYTSERSVDVQQLIYDYNTKLRVQEEREKEKQRLQIIILCTCFLLLSVIAIVLHYFRKKHEEKLILGEKLKTNERQIQTLKSLISSHESAIDRLEKDKMTLEEINSNIMFLHEEQQEQMLQQEKAFRIEINDRQNEINEAQKQIRMLENWQFTQTSIYQKIIELRKLSNENEVKRALSSSDYEKLRSVLFSLNKQKVQELKEHYPLLQDDDILLYILEQCTNFDTKAIAISLGTTSTHAILQRRYRMRKRMDISDS